ncbi:YebC/PmpR family DNA-binding transcriptional regulator [Oligoflexia bacterium]|nr:YebC/PmpR family DNA-binding transcriptional regulator [Oligoflexia bacterium]
MSGHSKWSTIKRKKASVDSKRGKLFTKLLKEVQIAAKMGGGNPDGNPRLSAAIATAKSNSVPADNIDRAIKRGTGDMEGVDYEEITYEAYGPGGVAILVKVLTDNKNRSVAEVRHALTRSNGSLGGTNSVAYLFEEKGIITVAKAEVGEEELFEVALEAGAEDVTDEGDVWQVVTAPADFGAVEQAIGELDKQFEGEVQFIPNNTVAVSGKDADTLLKLLDMLDDLDDVQNVVANFEMDDSELEKAH